MVCGLQAGLQRHDQGYGRPPERIVVSQHAVEEAAEPK
jgi:hypothetical protein